MFPTAQQIWSEISTASDNTGILIITSNHITSKQILEQRCSELEFPRSWLDCVQKKLAPVTPRKLHTSHHMQRWWAQLAPAFSSQRTPFPQSSASIKPAVQRRARNHTAYVCLYWLTICWALPNRQGHELYLVFYQYPWRPAFSFWSWCNVNLSWKNETIWKSKQMWRIRIG